MNSKKIKKLRKLMRQERTGQAETFTVNVPHHVQRTVVVEKNGTKEEKVQTVAHYTRELRGEKKLYRQLKQNLKDGEQLWDED